MKKSLSNERGVTIITVTLMIIVITIILSVVTFYARNSIQMEQFGNMRADIEEIENKAQIYYLENNGVLPICGEDDSQRLKHRVDMLGDTEFFNPNDSDDYYKVDTSKINVNIAYDTTYYINDATHTVYAIDPIKLSGKIYPRPKETFDELEANLNIPDWEEECYSESEVISNFFLYNSEGYITGVNVNYCNSHRNDSYYSNYNNWNKMVIPAYQPNGDPVSGIAKGAFSSVSNIKELRIPNTIQRVVAESFSSNTNTNYFYCDAREMDLEAFRGFKEVDQIHFGPYSTIPDADSSSQGIFANCSHLKYVWIDTTAIGKYAFYGNRDLQLIVFNNNVEIIPEGAFAGCVNGNMTIVSTDSLEESWPNISGNKEFPSKLKKIDTYAFYNSASICGTLDFRKNIYLTEIGAYAFIGCRSIQNVILPSNTKFELTSFETSTSISQ